jgi:excisionase family DNA binding protein
MPIAGIHTVEQVAKMLHIGRDKVYYLLRTGQLRQGFVKVGVTECD